MRRSSVPALSTALLLAHACGSGSVEVYRPEQPNSMSASIDGTAWNAFTVVTAKSTDRVAIGGRERAHTVTISFAPTAVGTQTIGPTSVVSATVFIGTEYWQANAAGQGGGSVTLTTLTSTRAVGTFTFTAVASQGTTPAQRQVTNGKFDVQY